MIPGVWFRRIRDQAELGSDYSVNVALYYIAQKKGFLNPMTVPLDELNLDDYEP